MLDLPGTAGNQNMLLNTESATVSKLILIKSNPEGKLVRYHHHLNVVGNYLRHLPDISGCGKFVTQHLMIRS